MWLTPSLRTDSRITQWFGLTLKTPAPSRDGLANVFRPKKSGNMQLGVRARCVIRGATPGNPDSPMIVALSPHRLRRFPREQIHLGWKTYREMFGSGRRVKETMETDMHCCEEDLFINPRDQVGISIASPGWGLGRGSGRLAPSATMRSFS